MLSPELIIGKKLKDLREKKGMSQQDVADNFNESRQWYNAIEKGRVKNIKYEYLIGFVELFDVPLNTLLGIDDRFSNNDENEKACKELEKKNREIERLNKKITELQEKVIKLYEKNEQTN